MNRASILLMILLLQGVAMAEDEIKFNPKETVGSQGLAKLKINTEPYNQITFDSKYYKYPKRFELKNGIWELEWEIDNGKGE